MGIVIGRDKFQRASSARLRDRLIPLCHQFKRAEREWRVNPLHSAAVEEEYWHAFREIGRLIYEESQRAFNACDLPPQMANAPWTWVVKQLSDGWPKENWYSALINESVPVFLKSLAKQPTLDDPLFAAAFKAAAVAGKRIDEIGPA